MTSHIPALKHPTPATPERRRPVSLVAGSTQEEDQKTWTAHFRGLISEVVPLTTVQALPREPVMSSKQHANHCMPSLQVQKSGTILLPEYLVFRTAYILPMQNW